MSFHCRRREVDTKEPPGAEAPGAVGLHGPFQNKQRSSGGYQLARTVSSPFSSAPLPSCPSPLSPPTPSCQLSHQTTRHMFRKPPAALGRLLWQQSPVKAWTGPCTFLSYAHQHTYNHIRAVCALSHRSWPHCSFSSNTRAWTIWARIRAADWFVVPTYKRRRSRTLKTLMRQMQIYIDLLFIRLRGWGMSTSSMGGDLMHHWELVLWRSFN